MKRIAILASGSGTNAEKLITHFRTKENAEVVLVLSNKPGAGVLERASQLQVEHRVFSRENFYGSTEVLDILKERKVDFLVLAGFLWLVPGYLLEAFPRKMVNIHPALLPKYGGKGMYGHHVHEAVIEAGEAESGITIHYVNTRYDEGNIIFQASCPVEKYDTADTLAARIHQLEHAHFPRVVEELLEKL